MMKMRNRNISLLNLHAALQRYSNKTLDVFGGVYFYTHGVPFSVIALVWSASFLLRFLLRPLSIWLSDRIGLKKALILGTLASSGLFLVFNQVDGMNAWLGVFALYLAFYDILYWLPYHAYYAISGEEEHRGKQVALGVGLISIVQIVVPLAGALLATKFGFNYLYISAMICMVLSVIPVLFAKNISPGIKMSFKTALKEIDKRGLVMSIGNGIVNNGHDFIWMIVVFILAGSLVDFGGLITIQLLITAIVSYLVGHYMDKGKARWAARLGSLLLVAAIVSRSFWVTDASEIIFSSLVAALGGALLDMPYIVALYDFAHKSHNALWFHFFAEAGWDIGSFLVLVMAAALAALGVPLQHLMLLALPGLLIIDHVLKSRGAVKSSPNNTSATQHLAPLP